MNKINLTCVAPVPIQGHTSKGDQPKWFYKQRWFKADHMGYESLSEVLISRLLTRSNAGEFVTYEPVQIQYQDKEYVGCVSDNFKANNEMLIPFERLHRAYKGRGLAEILGGIDTPVERIRYAVNFVEAVTGLTQVGPYLTTLLELDALFLNEDRHTNNLAVLRNEHTMEFRLCPIFDNGLALLSDTNDYPPEDDIYSCIARVHAKPFDRDFLTQVEAAEELYGVQWTPTFCKADVTRELATLSGLYEENILKRVETVLFEQMRRYSYLFQV